MNYLIPGKMNRNEVEILLQRFFEAETTLREEHLLKDYFQHEQVDSEFEPYKAFFTGLVWENDTSDTSGIEESVMDYILEKEVATKSRYRQMWLTVTGIAASLLIAVGGMLFYQQQQAPFRDTFTDPNEAMAYAQETLMFMSEKYNNGLAQLQPMQVINEAVQPLENGIQTFARGMATVTGSQNQDNE
jgi:hypothetical protein